jgi:hypothetical protein
LYKIIIFLDTMTGLVTNCVTSKQQKGMSQLTAVEPVEVVDEWTQYMCIVNVDELADVADASAAVGALQFRRCIEGRQVWYSTGDILQRQFVLYGTAEGSGYKLLQEMQQRQYESTEDAEEAIGVI